MKELGGYMEIEQFHGRLYYPDAIAVNTARNALAYLLLARKIDAISIPRLLCDSVSGVCARLGVSVTYYDLTEDLRPLASTLSPATWTYVVNYYGVLSNSEIQALAAHHPRLILDNVQAFFQRPVAGVDTIYSCRKYFGVPDGAYLVTDAKFSPDIPCERTGERVMYLVGRLESTASECFAGFTEANRSLGQQPLRRMSKFSANLLRGVDYDRVKRVRGSNYRLLRDAFRTLNGLNLKEIEGAFAYPLLVEDGMNVRPRLHSRGLYVPTLWPEVVARGPRTSLESRMAADILPLPCDQRYGPEDMEYLIEGVRECLD